MVCRNAAPAAALLLAAVLATGCTPAQYAAWADRDAYRTLRRGHLSATGTNPDFDIAYRPVDVREYLSADRNDGGNADAVLTLHDALVIGLRNSRDFQTRKEQLFSAALELANLSREWEGGLLSGNTAADADMVESARDGADGGTDSTARTITAAGTPAIARRLIGGGLLTLGATTDFATDFLGLSDTEIGSLLEANLTQPLLRGAWRGLAYEDQYRLRRDFLIAVFEFSRFRETFAVDIIQDYYDVLNLRDRVENDRENIRRLEETMAMTRVLVEGGQVSRIQLDQAEQDLLNARVRLESTRLVYLNALDNFKISLGLPVSTEMVLDYPGALERLRERGPDQLPFAEQAAVATALVSRTELLDSRTAVRDGAKDVKIAADEFNPQLDLELEMSVPGTEKTRPGRLQPHRHTRAAKLTFDYELDQTDNRDAYRNTLIALQQKRRDLEKSEDEIRLSVRRSYRELEQSRRSYELQVENVAIARRRRKLAALQQKQGEASARDVLEAEESLRNALNGLTGSLVSYTKDRLAFLAALGMIACDTDGEISERQEPFGFDRLMKHYPYLATGGPERWLADDTETRK